MGSVTANYNTVGQLP